MPKAIEHALMNTATYRSWQSMKRRCLSPNAHNYKHYGGRGIKICARWMTFVNFADDMGERPSGHTLDRIDNDGMYCPENCKWSTQAEQSRNRSSSVRVTLDGKTMTATDAAKLYGIHRKTIAKRVASGVDGNDAVLGGRGKIRSHGIFKYNGQVMSFVEMSRLSGIPYKTLHRRVVSLNWSVEKAMETPLRR